MVDIIKLPDNFIGLEDREKLESFGGHSIAHGRATRWRWGRDQHGDDVFDIFRGGADERLAAHLTRDRKLDSFCAHDQQGKQIASGELEHVLAALDNYLMLLHGELPHTDS